MVTFEAVEQALSQLDAVGTAAQSHGLLCALLASGAALSRQAWIDSMVVRYANPKDYTLQRAMTLLTEWFDETTKAVNGLETVLLLCLPNAQAPMEQRIEALTSWAQGFLSGLKLSGIDVEHPKDPLLADPLQQVIGVACMDYHGEKTGHPGDENALTTLCDHIRDTVALVRQQHLKSTV